ncbi:cell division protein SepF [Halobellus marinus]|uniref:cell division protein SepF n=1 Tax=Halobellus TaxID=1073986 RepID=UPI0028B0474B|nr:cell division protein SepF [Halobellus sp. DFY28]
MTRQTVPTDRLVARLDALGFGVDEPDTTTEIKQFDTALDLETAAVGLDLEEIVYDPDRFPGLIYRPDDAAAVAVLFDDGTLFVESADPAAELVADITLGLVDLGMVGGPNSQVTDEVVVSPSEVPVPPEFAEGRRTSVYPEEGAGTDHPPTDESETKVYEADATDTSTGGDGQSVGDGPRIGDTVDDPDTAASTASQGSRVHVATVSEKRDAMVIIDAIYDGDLVIADITRHNTADGTVEKIVDSLRQVTEDVGGDIVQKGEDELILAPGGMEIAREKLT